MHPFWIFVSGFLVGNVVFGFLVIFLYAVEMEKRNIRLEKYCGKDY